MKTHPAFADQAEIVLLSGFSGALIALLRDANGTNFVRKVAEKPDGSAKLKRQADQQIALGAMLGGLARMPEVLREGDAGGCYWFDMTFVPGRDGVTYLADASYSQFEQFSARLADLLRRLAEPVADSLEFRPAAPILAKLDEIDGKTKGAHTALLAPLRVAADKMDFTLPTTRVHGDLTLENIIVDRSDQLWLIDTIESPFDHYWIDLSKLFQDCEGRWFRHRGRALSLGVSWELRQRLHTVARAMDSRYAGFHNLLLALTFARILPYAQGQPDIDFVARRVAIFAEASKRALENPT